MATIAVAHTPPPVDTSSSWKTLRDQRLGFELRHPATWQVGRSTGTLESVVLGEPARAGASRVVMQVLVQRGINPDRLSIGQWYADQLRRLRVTEPPPTTSALIGGRTTIRRDMSRPDARQYDFYTAINASDVFQVSIKQPAGAAGLDRTHEAVLSTIKFIEERAGSPRAPAGAGRPVRLGAVRPMKSCSVPSDLREFRTAACPGASWIGGRGRAGCDADRAGSSASPESRG
jgi:hypothetical protein